MSFKNKLLQIYAKYDLNPTSLSKKLGYKSAEKIARLTRDEKNLPSYDILSDILKAFPQMDARWLFNDEMIQVIHEPDNRSQYGFCKECIKKEAIIEHQARDIVQKQHRIDELLLKLGKLGESNASTNGNAKVS